ncbi:2TM domain-containing protein [Lacinutrix iliipiscaria]|uniref:2TM domain-containing protein n=1 Tax=Lacinutrix iliipiscaria TaxID=1230532 RepID=A0ABW5WS34_9FLAO
METNHIEPYKETDHQRSLAYKRAEKRLKETKTFYQHLLAYCLFTPFTIFINYLTYWDYKWFWYSLIPWGFGLAIHAFIVFVHKGRGLFGSHWEQRKIEQYLREEERNKKWN